MTLPSLDISGALTLVLLTFISYQVWSWWKLRHIPGPALGSISQSWLLWKAVGGRFHEALKDASDTYGPLVRVGPDELLCTDPDVLRRMSAARSAYQKGRFYDSARLRPDDNNVVAQRDELLHKEMRARMGPAFANRPTEFEKGIDAQLGQLVHLIETKYLSDTIESTNGSDKRYRPVDMARIFQFFALDVIGDISFSGAFGFLSEDKDLYQLNEINESGLTVQSFIMAVPWVTDLLFKWPFNLMLPREGDQIGVGRIMGLVSDIIKPRLENREAKKKDMLEACIDAGMSRDELQQMVIVLIIAGSVSSSYAMTMTLLCLINNPRVYTALRSEIDSAIASGAIQKDQPITDSEARALPYLQAVLHEGFRMYPPLAGMGSKQVPPGGDVINGYFVPGGTQVGHNFLGIQRLKSFWGDDADIFRPERWLEAGAGTEREKEMLGVLDLNFGWGKYQCLGKNIAMMELNKVFVELLRRFDFSLVSATHPITIRSAAFMMAKDLQVTITDRRQG